MKTTNKQTNKHKHVPWASYSQNKFQHKAGASRIPPLPERCWHLIVARRKGSFFNDLILDRLTTHHDSTTTGLTPWAQ